MKNYVFKVYDFKGNMYVSDPQEMDEKEYEQVNVFLRNFKELNGFSIEKDGKVRFFNPRYIANILIDEEEEQEEVNAEEVKDQPLARPRKKTFTV